MSPEVREACRRVAKGVLEGLADIQRATGLVRDEVEQLLCEVEQLRRERERIGR
jgi:hypothetical protein